MGGGQWIWGALHPGFAATGAPLPPAVDAGHTDALSICKKPAGPSASSPCPSHNSSKAEVWFTWRLPVQELLHSRSPFTSSQKEALDSDAEGSKANHSYKEATSAGSPARFSHFHNPLPVPAGPIPGSQCGAHCGVGTQELCPATEGLRVRIHSGLTACTRRSCSPLRQRERKPGPEDTANRPAPWTEAASPPWMLRGEPLPQDSPPLSYAPGRPAFGALDSQEQVRPTRLPSCPASTGAHHSLQPSVPKAAQEAALVGCPGLDSGSENSRSRECLVAREARLGSARCPARSSLRLAHCE